ncbi:MAG: flagellar basal body-associated protein FliL [Desulfobacterales bacterium]|nr:MAG: flagellar basal body-associated protein FliL [Desulfobacterales bacterium]
MTIIVSGVAGCGEKTPDPNELVLGNWVNRRNRTYVLLVISPKGTWNSSVRIADVTSKIVSSKGDAKGAWHMEDGQIIFTVVESNIEGVWKKNETRFFEIVDLQDGLMVLKEENGRIDEWKKTSGKQGNAESGGASVVIPMKPFAVNLDKHSSNSKDRYLCLNLSLALKELMPGQEMPTIHPRARDAVILFLSALIYGDVENFDKIKQQKEKLLDILNPYMEGVIKDVNIEDVVIASSITNVEEFLIEHTVAEAPEGEGESGDSATEETSEDAAGEK